MEMNPTVPSFQSRIEDDQPYQDQDGNLFVPLTGDRWELIVDTNGTISLGCLTQAMGGVPAQRWIATIGEMHEEIECHEDLVEGINFVRSMGQSLEGPN